MERGGEFLLDLRWEGLRCEGGGGGGGGDGGYE